MSTSIRLDLEIVADRTGHVQYSRRRITRLCIVFILADVLLSFGRDYQCTQSTSFLGPGMSVGNGGGGISGVGVFEDQVSSVKCFIRC